MNKRLDWSVSPFFRFPILFVTKLRNHVHCAIPSPLCAWIPKSWKNEINTTKKMKWQFATFIMSMPLKKYPHHANDKSYVKNVTRLSCSAMSNTGFFVDNTIKARCLIIAKPFLFDRRKTIHTIFCQAIGGSLVLQLQITCRQFLSVQIL